MLRVCPLHSSFSNQPEVLIYLYTYLGFPPLALSVSVFSPCTKYRYVHANEEEIPMTKKNVITESLIHTFVQSCDLWVPA